MESLDNLVIPTNWTFKNASVANNFESHVREQLPWYDLVSGAVAHIVRHYLPEKGKLYDIGASTGNMTRLLEGVIRTRGAEAISIENSQQMADKWDGFGTIHVGDATRFQYAYFDVAVLFLTVMFFPVIERESLFQKLLGKLRPGGVIIVVDKEEAVCGYLATVLSRLTLAGKVATGTNSDEIVQKELSLAGVQRPLKESDLPEGAVRFFKFGEFGGWIITK